ncbi:putative GPI mannosyltransferase 3 [Paratrimastix pyriformis]|uniref:Mannosyltransferase n=1 Tax=Paratrimastix pyriformis TaxID=342808 RepID=A0ABQ8UU14_9EUKA|nr:putative GPI mannosyltransferase 3 [Paratrimastix pyriformis]
MLGPLVLFRALNALCLQTAFNPDEYWQALEVAHALVFRYGYLTWEWREMLRSYLYPLFFVVIYWILDLLHLDYAALLIHLPRILQSVFAALSDWATYHFAERLFGKNIARWTLFCSVFSWFNFFAMPRTLGNSMEAAFSVLAFLYWPFPDMPAPPSLPWSRPPAGKSHPKSRVAGGWISTPSSRLVALTLAFVAVAIRPTCAVMWGIIGLWTVLRMPLRMWPRFVLCETIPIGFNVFSGGGSFYGVHQLHWYLSSAIPTMLLTWTPLLLPSLMAFLPHPGPSRHPPGGSNPPARATLGLLWAMVGACVGPYTLVAHKEFRFILPIHPVLLCLCGYGLERIRARWMLASPSSHSPSSASSSNPLSSPPPPSLGGLKAAWRRSAGSRKQRGLLWALGLLVVGQLAAAAFFSLAHQRGTVSVLGYVRDPNLVPSGDAVLLLLPCHATPFQSHVHRPDIRLLFLDCAPLINGTASETQGYVDQADRFFADPPGFLRQSFLLPEAVASVEPAYHATLDWREYHPSTSHRLPLPEHIITYDSILPDIARLLEERGYHQVARYRHAFVRVDEKRTHDGRYVVVMSRRRPEAMPTAG